MTLFTVVSVYFLPTKGLFWDIRTSRWRSELDCKFKQMFCQISTFRRGKDLEILKLRNNGMKFIKRGLFFLLAILRHEIAIIARRATQTQNARFTLFSASKLDRVEPRVSNGVLRSAQVSWGAPSGISDLDSVGELQVATLIWTLLGSSEWQLWFGPRWGAPSGNSDLDSVGELRAATLIWTPLGSSKWHLWFGLRWRLI